MRFEALGIDRVDHRVEQVANWLDAHLSPRGVGVVIEAEHTCMTLRGVQVAGTSTSTSALKGLLRESPQSRAEFFACLRK